MPGGFFFTVPGIAIGLATLELCALWAALGPGVYWIRALVALAAGGVVSVGLMAGLVISGSFADADSIWIGVAVISATGPLLWFVAQLPFLALRWAFGWQIGVAPSQRALSISDFIGFTAIAAISLSGLQTLQYVDMPDFRSEFANSILVSSLVLFALQVSVGIPGLLIVFKSHDSFQSSSRLFGYIMCVILFIAMLLIAGLGARFAPALAALLGLLFVYAFAFCLPLMFHHDAGFKLWTTKSVATWRQEHSGRIAEQASEPVASKASEVFK